MIQLYILVSSALFIYLVAHKEIRKKFWGFFVGFISQPVWFIATLASGQWGISILSVWYMYCCWQGMKENK